MTTPKCMFYASISTRLFLVKAFLRMGKYEEARKQLDLSKAEIERYNPQSMIDPTVHPQPSIDALMWAFYEMDQKWGTHTTIEDLLTTYNALIRSSQDSKMDVTEVTHHGNEEETGSKKEV